jgi:hypothetical protein
MATESLVKFQNMVVVNLELFHNSTLLDYQVTGQTMKTWQDV